MRARMLIGVVAAALCFAAPSVAVAEDLPTPAAEEALPGTAGPLNYRSFELTANGSYEPLVGNFDCSSGTALPGIFWYGLGGAADYLWTGLEFADNKIQPESSRQQVNGRYEPFVGDFDRNGCTDIFWYAPGPGPDYVWYGSVTGFDSKRVSVGGTYLPVVLDFGAAVYWFNRSGADYLWRADGQTFGNVAPAPQWGGANDRPFYVPDTDSGGAIVWYRPGPAADFASQLDADGLTVLSTAEVPAIAGSDALDLDLQPLGSAPFPLLYGPGSQPDHLVTWADGFMNSFEVSVNGTYRAAAAATPADMIVWHAPGSTRDFFWIHSSFFSG